VDDVPSFLVLAPGSQKPDYLINLINVHQLKILKHLHAIDFYFRKHCSSCLNDILLVTNYC
jgi:hypothetical protein